MTGTLALFLGLPAAGAVIGFLCTRGYYRAAYGDRYEHGYADGRAAQIRAYQAASTPLSAWQKTGMRWTPPPETWPADRYGAGDRVTVLGPWHPPASGPPRYAQLSPEALGDDPPTSEWARDLIAGIEQWNAASLPARDLPWQG